MAWSGGRLAAVAAETRRPAAAQLLRGRTPDEAQTLVPRIFSLCGKAQAAACRAACAAALGRPKGLDDEAGRRADDARIVIEAGQEHLWRLLLDWPRELGLAAREGEFVAWHRRLAAAGKALDAARVAGDAAATHAALAELPPLAAALGDFLDAVLFAPVPAAAALHEAVLPAGSWAGRLLAAAAGDAWAAPRAARLLPRLPAADWVARLAGVPADFAARPTFAGAPAETGPLARHADRPLVAARRAAGGGIAARLAARLADLAELPGQLIRPLSRLDAAAGAPGYGLAGVETARGLLIHAVRLDDGRIADYMVVAPTEWNFHPDGAWRAELLDRPLATAADGERLLRRLALALDPCVPLAVEVTDRLPPPRPAPDVSSVSGKAQRHA